MNISQTFSKYFDSGVRNRGSSYYSSGLVNIQQGTDKSVYAKVRGTNTYKVNLKIDKNKLKSECSCPYFDEWGLCKHIWATLLTAENQGYLQRVILNRITEMDDGVGDLDDIDIIDEVFSKSLPKLDSYFSVPSKKVSWENVIDELGKNRQGQYYNQKKIWPSNREIIYVIDVMGTLTHGVLTIEVCFRQKKKNGEWGKIKGQNFSSTEIDTLPNPNDRQIISMLKGAQTDLYYMNSYSTPFRFHVSSNPLQNIILPLICNSGRCWLRIPQDEDENELKTIYWDDQKIWDFSLNINRDNKKRYIVSGRLSCGNESMELHEPILLISGGFVFTENKVSRLNDFNNFDWISLLREHSNISVPVSEGNKLVKKIVQSPNIPPLNLPGELQYEEIKVSPQPRLSIKKPKTQYGMWEQLYGELSFNYNGHIIQGDVWKSGIFIEDDRCLILRDKMIEQQALELLKELGFKDSFDYTLGCIRLEIQARNLPKIVGILVQKGWHIEAEGKLYRNPGLFKINVTSGLDWFDLDAVVTFDEQKISFPKLLTALKNRENMVLLGDGSFGILPEEWLKKYGMWLNAGKVEGDSLRFSKTQVCFLDALLSEQSEVSWDETFAKAREELKQFEGIRPEEASSNFVGTLRNYQREGLGWLIFLQKFGFGGCLADDMGLGKTVQVLALLDKQAKEYRMGSPNKNNHCPSLVVAPRSLIFNWKDEAARFTPQLKVLDHSSMNRSKSTEEFVNYDLILTTYGILRQDINYLKDFKFDYCILDESQAIKNAESISAKASRLLSCSHRLALSGTPIENHLGELWSLFEFLNPGILGSSSFFKLNNSELRNPDERIRSLLARGLRPFILRRTKSQVAKDLPAKTEQTIYCELESRQKQLYDELVLHYRQTLLNRVKEEGIKNLKIFVLEALLRLRQTACHPGLVDKARINESSAKLEALIPQISEVIEEGHKALIFSQFTSFLKIVGERLKQEKIIYEYLDGSTKDRAKRIERFQNDVNCPLFLISIKAGGLGLNLTAAEYVFILDPWWNPAVEAQAIDRTHRIGQTQPVFAYRLIGKSTVEEKILQLQKNKRDLADAIINVDNSLIRKLTREDLEILLG